jgi:hypothetical protein
MAQLLPPFISSTQLISFNLQVGLCYEADHVFECLRDGEYLFLTYICDSHFPSNFRQVGKSGNSIERFLAIG